MTETLYGVTWLEAVAPNEQNQGAVRQRKRATFKTKEERDFHMLVLESQPAFLYYLSQWEERNVV
jgi:hypothetical protein